MAVVESVLTSVTLQACTCTAYPPSLPLCEKLNRKTHAKSGPDKLVENARLYMRGNFFPILLIDTHNIRYNLVTLLLFFVFYLKKIISWMLRPWCTETLLVRICNTQSNRNPQHFHNTTLSSYVTSLGKYYKRWLYPPPPQTNYVIWNNDPH